MSPVVASSDFKEAMSRLAGAVSVIATGPPDRLGERRGMTVTAVCSVCAEPPSLLVCLHRSAGTSARILQVGAFSVNTLSERHLDVARSFAGQNVFGADRFGIGAWQDGRLGVPVLADAVASFECSLAQAYTHGTHTLMIGRIESVRWTADTEPLVFHARRFVGLGDDLAARSA